MASPFLVDPHLTNQFPSPDQVRAAIGVAAACEVVAGLWLTEGIPSIFVSSPAIYEHIRRWLAPRLAVSSKDITLLGSARVGYSLKASEFGRPFINNKSDLDLSIVSADLFRKVVRAFKEFSADYNSGGVRPRHERERIYWDENVKFGTRNIPSGFFDANKIPNFDRYYIAQEIGQSMWLLKEKLAATSGAPRIREASIRVYQDWPSLIRRVTFNLSTASKQMRQLGR